MISVEKIFKERKACWVHSGDPAEPHVELTSGLCSNAYFNCSRILSDPILVEELARLLCSKLKQAGIEDSFPDWVVGSAYGAITFSYEVAKQLGTEHAFTEKTSQPHQMSFKRIEIPKGSLILEIEDIITTFTTVRAVKEAIVRDNPYPVEFFPLVGTIIYRPAKFDKNSCQVVALMKKLVWSSSPSECPLCQLGSPRYRPKEMWDKFIENR